MEEERMVGESRDKYSGCIPHPEYIYQMSALYCTEHVLYIQRPLYLLNLVRYSTCTYMSSVTLRR
jgi:hypothetical protein